MPWTQLYLLHSVVVLALNVLDRFLAPYFFLAKLPSIPEKAAEADREETYEHCSTHRVLGLFAIAATRPALSDFTVSNLIDWHLKGSILCGNLDRVVFVFDPIQPCLEEYSTGVLDNSLLPLASGTARSRSIAQHRQVGASDGDEL